MPENQPQQQNNMQSTPSWYRQWWGVMILIFLILLISLATFFAFAVLKSVREHRAGLSTNLWLPQLTKVPNAKLGGKNHSFGTTSPKISIVEFSDFACHYCKREYPVLRQLMMANLKDYEFVYRDYPVVTNDSNALAMAGRCAGEQGLFWKMHDYLFENQGIKTETELIEAAKAIGAKTAQFTTCLQTKKYQTEITNDLNFGVGQKIEGTPTIYINNYRLPTGEIPLATLQEIIKEILNAN